MRYYLLLSVLFLVVSLSSCEKEIELTTNSNKCIVANALITEKQPIEVKIFRGVDYVGKRSSMPMNNANLFIYHNDSLLEEVNGTNDNSIYRTSVIPKVGETYSIKIDCQHYPTATATATIPNTVQIKVLNVGNSSVMPNDDDYGNVTLSITDNTQDVHYYMLTLLGYRDLYDNDSLITYSLTPIYNNFITPSTSMSDIINHMFESSDVVQIEEKDYILFTNKNWQTNTTTITFGLSYSFSYPALLTIMSFNEDYYKYFIAKEYLNTTGEDDFMFNEPINIHSNVNNGLGLFVGYNTTTIKLYSFCDTVPKP